MLEALSAHARRVSYHLGRGVNINGQRFKLHGYHATRLDPTDRHEPFLGAVLQRVLRRPGAFIDIGVNVGQTLMKVVAIDRGRAYFGFEPQTACCFYVDQFAKLNGLHNVTLLPIALSEENAMLTLYSEIACDEMASLASPLDVTGAVRSHQTFVPARIGDEVFREIGVDQIAAIKIDVEGAELQVLKGLQHTLRTHKPPVIFEVLPNFFGHARTPQPPEVCAANRAAAAAIASLFDGLGYRIWRIDQQGDEQPIDRFELDDREGFVFQDFIAHPR